MIDKDFLKNAFDALSKLRDRTPKISGYYVKVDDAYRTIKDIAISEMSDEKILEYIK